MRKQLSRALAVIETSVIKPIVSAAEKRQAAKGENVEDPRRIIRQGFWWWPFFGRWNLVGFRPHQRGRGGAGQDQDRNGTQNRAAS